VLARFGSDRMGREGRGEGMEEGRRREGMEGGKGKYLIVDYIDDDPVFDRVYDLV